MLFLTCLALQGFSISCLSFKHIDLDAEQVAIKRQAAPSGDSGHVPMWLKPYPVSTETGLGEVLNQNSDTLRVPSARLATDSVYH